jgi:Alginate lyase
MDRARTWAIAAGFLIIIVAVGLAVAGRSSPKAAPSPSPHFTLAGSQPAMTPPSSASITASPSAPPAGSLGYLVTVAELRDRAERAAAGKEPYAEAVDELLSWAPDALKARPHPSRALDIPGTDGPFVDDARRAYGLALAYVVTGEERYAEAAARTIAAWVDTMKTTRNTCPDSGACQTSLIVGRTGPGFAMAADLIRESAAWTPADQQALMTWVHDKLLPAASTRPNNWGDAGVFLRVVAADFSGDHAAFDDALETWRSFVDLIERDGNIPEESRRGELGILYTQQALQYKVAVAVIAERRGIDLWEYRGKAGGSLKRAIDRLAYYWTRPSRWPPFPNAVVPSPGPLWDMAYARWHRRSWAPIVEAARPYGDEGSSALEWTTLTNGVPVKSRD